MDEKLMLEIQEIDQTIKGIEEQLNIVDQQINELNYLSKGIAFLGENEENEILASMGKGVFIKSGIKDRKLFVDVGAGVFVRKSITETKEISENQLKRLGDIKNSLLTEIDRLNNNLREMIEKIQSQQNKL